MQLEIKLIDPRLPIPQYKTSGAAAFDLYSRIDIEIPPQTIKLVPLNVVIKTPEGYFLLIAARSSTPIKKGLMAANGIGIIDQDFCGEDDELHLEAYNFTDRPVQVKRGDRIAQAMLIKLAKADFTQVKQMSAPSRGGFGSTGE